MHRIVLVALAVIAISAIGGAAYWVNRGAPPSAVDAQGAQSASRTSGRTGESAGTPRLAVTTTENLNRIVLAWGEARSRVEDSEASDTSEAPPPPTGNAQDDKDGQGTDVQSVSAATVQPPSTRDGEDFAGVFEDAGTQRALVTIYADPFENELIGYLDRTERFQLVDSSNVYRLFREMTENQPVPPEVTDMIAQAQEEARRSQRSAQILELMPSLIASGSRGTQEITANLQEIGRRADIDYLLILGFGEPNFSLDTETLAYSDTHRHVVRANPTFTIRLLDVESGSIVLADQARLEGGLAIEVDHDTLAGGLTRTEAQRIIGEVNYDHFSRIAASVSAAVLNEINPATIASLAPDIVLTRGRTDGVSVGAEYDVYRISMIDDPSGARIRGPRRSLGQVRIIQADENVSIARRIDSDTTEFAVGDRVDIPLNVRSDDPEVTPTGLAATAGNRTSTDPLGEAREGRRQLGAATRDSAAPRIAVGEFETRGEGLSTAAIGDISENLEDYFSGFEDDVRRGITRSLAGDPRFVVLSRQDLDRIQQEYDLARQTTSSGAVAGRPQVDIAGYIVTGSLRFDLERERRTASLGGQTRELASRYHLNATGEVQIVGTDGQVVAAERVPLRRTLQSAEYAALERVESELAAELAETATALIRTSLYPIQVAGQSAGGNYIITAGRGVVEIGTRLRAFSVGDPVTDPVSGVIIAEGSREFAGMLTVTDVDDNVSYATPDDTAVQLDRGDRIEIAPHDDAGDRDQTTQPATTEPARARPF